MANGGSDRIRITKDDLTPAQDRQRQVTPDKQAPGPRRGLLIVGSVIAGIAIIVLVVLVLAQAPSPNRKCWQELQAALVSLGEAPGPGHFRLALKRLKNIDLTDVTDGDLIEAHRLALDLIQYQVDYPDTAEGVARAIRNGATLDVANLLRHLEMGVEGEDKVAQLSKLLDSLEQRYAN